MHSLLLHQNPHTHIIEHSHLFQVCWWLSCAADRAEAWCLHAGSSTADRQCESEPLRYTGAGAAALLALFTGEDIDIVREVDKASSDDGTESCAQ